MLTGSRRPSGHPFTPFPHVRKDITRAKVVPQGVVGRRRRSGVTRKIKTIVLKRSIKKCFSFIPPSYERYGKSFIHLLQLRFKVGRGEQKSGSGVSGDGMWLWTIRYGVLRALKPLFSGRRTTIG